MAARHPSTIGNAVLFEFVATSAYGLLILLGSQQQERLLGLAVEGWIGLTAPAVQVAFALVPIPPGLGEAGLFDEVGVYRHILAACILIACGCFMGAQRDRPNWAERIMGSLSVTPVVAERRRHLALYGYRRMIIGVAALMLLALFGEYQVPAVANYLYAAGWTYIRAPLLIAIAFSFACHAAALHRCIDAPL